MRCGKTIYQWFFNKSNEVYGSVHTTLDDIKKESDLVHFFVKYIYFPQNTNDTPKKGLGGFLMLLFGYLMNNFLVLLGMNRLLSTRIQPIIHSIKRIFLFLKKQKNQ